jgi:hypothetical protein
MTTHPNDNDAWPPLDPTDEELAALIQDRPEEPEDLPQEAEDIPFADVDSEEIDPTLVH